MNLTADLKDKARLLLGGKNVTRKRLETLLQEVETARRNAALQEQAERRAEEYILAHADEVFPQESPETAVESPGAASEPTALPLPSPSAMSPEIQALLAQIEAMRQEIAALRQPEAEKERVEAMGAGKLPVPNQPGAFHGPVGFTGSATLPQGVWFKSPFGLSIEMRLCDCPRCPTHRKTHYYCVICRQGPFEYERAIGGRKIWMAPGGAWGVSHESCSSTCWMRYMELMGRPMGMNLPPTPGLAADSPQTEETNLPQPRGVMSD